MEPTGLLARTAALVSLGQRLFLAVADAGSDGWSFEHPPEYEPRRSCLPGGPGGWTPGPRSDQAGVVRVAADPSDRQAQGEPTVQVDGGDLGCGELLVLLYRRVRDEPAGTVVAVSTSDAAARIDLPAWCHLTGHRYLGPSRSDTYLVQLAERPRSVRPDRPWHRPTVEENR